MLIRVGHTLAIDLCYIWESVHYEGSQENCVRDLIIFNWEACKSLEGLELRYLDKTVDIVVLEQESFQVHESFQLWDVGWTDNVVKPNILERNLDNSLLKFDVVKNL